jgi:sulfoxide reductase heme-binding subunit YedZ
LGEQESTKPVSGRSRSNRRRRASLKVAVGVLAAIPALLTTFRFLTGDLGANPIAEAMNRIGFWTLTLLLATLACTPLKILFGWNWPPSLRRMLGLITFSYACLHFSIYLVLEQFFDWNAIWEDIAKRKFITIGFAALVLMIPLAVTSTNKMVKRLGFPLWKRLHRLSYLIALLAILHFVWRVKIDLLAPLSFAGVLALLFAIRLHGWRRLARARRGACARRGA